MTKRRLQPTEKPCSTYKRPVDEIVCAAMPNYNTDIAPMYQKDPAARHDPPIETVKEEPAKAVKEEAPPG